MTALSLASVLAEPARRRPDVIGVVEGDRRVSYAELWRRARQVAAVLIADGAEPGARVAILAPNVVEFVTAYYGVIAAGCVVVPIPTLLTGDEAAFLLRDSGAEVLLHHPAFDEVARGAVATTGVRSHSVVGLGEDAEPIATFVSREAEDLAVIFYTSGTTGRPKGALLSHLNLVMNATTNAFDSNGLSADDVVFGGLPLFHTYGQTAAMGASFRVGGTLVLQPRFQPAEAIELMVRERVTRFLGVPTMYVQLLRAAADAPQLPAIESCTSGGAPLPVAVLEEFEKVFHTRIYEGYGLSETSPTASVNQKVFGTRAGTVGHSVWGVDVEIADASVPDHIVFLAAGEPGEIVIRGHNVFAGYLNNPEATAEAIQDGGWFRTGDIGTKDADGFITIVDRRKDLIIRGGFNVYPREVEEVLMRHPAVGQVAVIGVPDPEKGEEIAAIVVPAPGQTVDRGELVEWAKEHLARHKYPRLVEVVEELPLGPSHKVLKRELRQQFLDHHPERPSSPA